MLKSIEGTGLNNSGDILSGNDNDENNKSIKLIQNYLKNNNRFSNITPEKPYTSTDNIDEDRELNINNSFGKYDKNKYRISYEQLKKVGAAFRSSIYCIRPISRLQCLFYDFSYIC